MFLPPFKWIYILLYIRNDEVGCKLSFDFVSHWRGDGALCWEKAWQAPLLLWRQDRLSSRCRRSWIILFRLLLAHLHCWFSCLWCVWATRERQQLWKLCLLCSPPCQDQCRLHGSWNLEESKCPGAYLSLDRCIARSRNSKLFSWSFLRVGCHHLQLWGDWFGTWSVWVLWRTLWRIYLLTEHQWNLQVVWSLHSFTSKHQCLARWAQGARTFCLPPGHMMQLSLVQGYAESWLTSIPTWLGTLWWVCDHLG